LELKVSSDVNPASVFQEALAYINETAGEQFKVDPDAAVFLVTADLSKVAGNGFPCQCECGSSGNCGGGGGGHSRARGDV
jgi:hypothetical protein